MSATGKILLVDPTMTSNILAYSAGNEQTIPHKTRPCDPRKDTGVGRNKGDANSAGY